MMETRRASAVEPSTCRVRAPVAELTSALADGHKGGGRGGTRIFFISKQIY